MNLTINIRRCQTFFTKLSNKPFNNLKKSCEKIREIFPESLWDTVVPAHLDAWCCCAQVAYAAASVSELDTAPLCTQR